VRLAITGVALLLLVTTAGVAHAVPHTVSFTARITDTAGNPASGAVTIKVALFDAAAAGTMIWEETHTGVPAVNGLVFTSLGDVDPANNALTNAIFDDRELYAELTVDGDVLSPRIPIASVPYALRADVADALQGFDPTTSQKRVTGACTTGNYITAINSDGSVACGVDSVGTGDITGVTAGIGLTGGGLSGGVTLAVDTTVIQARVVGTCATGTFITAVGANGAVTCGTDQVGIGDITGVAAGTGLTGGGLSGAVTLAVDTTVIQARVVGTCATGTFITAVSATGAVTCATGGAGTITGVTAGTGLAGGGASGAVTVGIANSGVNTAQIADGAVTMAKTNAPIGSDSINFTAAQNNGSQFFVGTNSFVADTAGRCFVSVWAQSDSASNAPFYVEPMLTNAAGMNVLPNPSALVPSVFPNEGSYMASSSATIDVIAGNTYRAGCHIGTVGFPLATPQCHVSWICN
jgi:hypothetical protein